MPAVPTDDLIRPGSDAEEFDPRKRQGVDPMWDVLRLATKALRQKAVLRTTPEQIAALQRRRLRDLVARAKADSPFYAERLLAVDPGRVELAQLPTLTKTEMMANFDRFLTDRRL